MERLLRYRDLLAIGVVRNRATLRNWIKKQNFPRGRLLGPNTRTWPENEVQAWLSKRPITAKLNMPVVTRRPGRPRKNRSEPATTA
jgi:predicted DNA-binding transcriptional regulator AlpA